MPRRRGEWATGEALVRTAVTAFGGLDILVNNAGVLRDRMVFSMSEEEWDPVIRVHLRGHFVTTRFATAYWRERSKKTGRPVYARIVNTVLRGVPARLGRPAQLRGRQGRHRGADPGDRARLRPVRRARQRHLPARPHRDDRRADGRRRRTVRTRWRRSASRRW